MSDSRITSNDITSHHTTWHHMTWHPATNHITSPHVTSELTAKHITSCHLTSKWPHYIPPLTHHLTTSRCHQNTTTRLNGWRWLKAGAHQQKRFGHRTGWSPVVHSTGKFLLWLKIFHPETFATASPGKCLCICMYMYSYTISMSFTRLLFTRIGQVSSEYLQPL